MFGFVAKKWSAAGWLTNSECCGRFWVINEVQGEMMGTSMTGIQTIGYDATKKMYVGHA